MVPSWLKLMLFFIINISWDQTAYYINHYQVTEYTSTPTPTATHHFFTWDKCIWLSIESWIDVCGLNILIQLYHSWNFPCHVWRFRLDNELSWHQCTLLKSPEGDKVKLREKVTTGEFFSSLPPLLFEIETAIII